MRAKYILEAAEETESTSASIKEANFEVRWQKDLNYPTAKHREPADEKWKTLWGRKHQGNIISKLIYFLV